MRHLSPADRQHALDAIDWAGGPEGAAVDLDSSLQIRRLLRRPLDDAGWSRAWRLAAELVVQANAARRLPVEREPVVLAALDLLEADRADPPRERRAKVQSR